MPEPDPPDTDVHLRIPLGDLLLDYRTTATAAHNFITDWRRTHCEIIEIITDTPESRRHLPRLPCETLFLHPCPPPLRDDSPTSPLNIETHYAG